MKYILSFAVFFFLGQSAQAAYAYQMKGKLISYNHQTVTLEIKGARKVQVPLSFLTYYQRAETHLFLNKEMSVVLPYAQKDQIKSL